MKRRIPHATTSRLPHGVSAAPVALGLGYLALLATFAMASPARPPALGWLGFGLVALVVVAVTWALGEWLAPDDGEGG